jgi:hypothetical protein
MWSSTHPKVVATSFLVLMAAGTVPAQETPSLKSGSIAEQLPAEARVVYRYVTQPLPGELRWRQIPWLLDLDEAVRRAREENRPLLLFVSGDEPLGRC